MSTDNLIEIARQTDAILGDQDDGFEGFETQMRRALARSDQVGADAIEVLVDDIDAAMLVCGHQARGPPSNRLKRCLIAAEAP